MLAVAGYLFALSLVAALAATPAAIRLAGRLKVVDPPGPRKIHQEPVPLAGGWALFAVLTVVLWGHMLAALLLRGTSHVASLPPGIGYYLEVAPAELPKLAAVWGGAALIFGLGLVDDLRRLSVRSRLWIQGAVALGLVLLGLRPNLGFLPAWAGAVLGILWIVGITNAFNFLDGLDGLSTGVALIATGGLLAILTLRQQPVVTGLLAVMAGAQAGFLRYNFHPARAFLGSSGSLLLGYLMAVATLGVTYMVRLDNWLIPILTPVFILAIPLYDTTSVILIRILRGRAIAGADQSHFHHRLLRTGFTHPQAVLFIYLIAFAVTVSAVLLVQTTPGQSLLVFLQIAATFLVLVMAERVAARGL
jgi:UDP-GlcNAc:undecaprenyl-phosphate GlcNAc-1-phosphate transferase